MYTVSTSIFKQTERLQIVEKQCRSFTDMHQKVLALSTFSCHRLYALICLFIVRVLTFAVIQAVTDFKNKVATSLCATHIDAVRNIIRLRIANSNSSLE